MWVSLTILQLLNFQTFRLEFCLDVVKGKKKKGMLEQNLTSFSEDWEDDSLAKALSLYPLFFIINFSLPAQNTLLFMVGNP